jgi:cyclic beta-1,2-glucan synthetase
LTKCANKIIVSIDSTICAEAHWWAQALLDQCSNALAELDLFAPWILSVPALSSTDNPDSLESILTMRNLAGLDTASIALLSKGLSSSSLENESECLRDLQEAIAISSKRAKATIADLVQLAMRASEFANMQYGFLFDQARGLLAIGYNISENRLDASRYDLLASEARLCCFVAIAQGQIPERAWFALGRNITTIDGEPVLLSWNGSMLEYLMPLLVMPTFDNTLLDQTYKTAVKRQIEYGNQNNKSAFG